jgi:hypothetical protein
VDVLPAIVANEPQFASVKEEALFLSESLDWRCAAQRGNLSAAMLIDPPAGDRRMASSAGSVSHRSWRMKRETREKGATSATRARPSRFSRASKVFPQLLNPASHQQNDQDQKNQT